MTITLEAVKAEQTKLGEMIAQIEADMKKSSFFEYGGKRIPLAPGERYVGTIISADRSKNHHIILMPGEAEPANWKTQTKWAESVGGELPDRCEGALLFATMKDEFQPEWYWTREPRVSASDYAWRQNFNAGYQDYSLTNLSFRARAVRRLEIQ